MSWELGETATFALVAAALGTEGTCVGFGGGKGRGGPSATTVGCFSEGAGRRGAEGLQTAALCSLHRWKCNAFSLVTLLPGLKPSSGVFWV